MVQMTKIPLKRAREADNHFDTITTMANCLMLLSKNRASSEYNTTTTTTTNYSSNNRVFECKTCNRQFPSFQALGGHRASHKKPRLGGGLSLQTQLPAKPKTHECSICGLEFAIGQALGGHMRRHRVLVRIGNDNRSSISSGSASPPREPMVKKSKVVDQRRVWGLDLNLSPFENDLKFQLGKMAPPVGCFL